MSNDFEIPAKSNKNSVKPMPTKKPLAEVVSDVTAETPEKVAAVSKEIPAPEKYDQTELLRIFDDIIFSGEYIEEVIIRGRLPVKFSTRTAKQVGEIQDALDSAGLTLISSIEQRRMLLGLEQALVSFNGKDLTGLSKKDRSEFIGQLAGPVIGMLLTAMSDFDTKIQAACREEANF
jgi:hypothetical protein